MILIFASGYAITIDEIFTKYSIAKDANVTNINEEILDVASKQAGSLAQYMKSIYIIELDLCSDSIKQDFSNDMKNIKDDFYNLFVKDNDNGKKNLIYSSQDNNSMIVFVIDNENYEVIKISNIIDGTISQ